MLMICLPVQRGSGLRIAGMGSSPGSSCDGPLLPPYFDSIQITRFMASSLVKKVSLMVKR